MNMIFKISFRNLVRQKRRNILLGSGIAFGMCILIIANSFSHGISDILLNKVIVNITGHIMVSRIERSKELYGMIRDKERIKQVILEHVDGVKDIQEDVSTYGRGLGNGSAAFLALMGMEPGEAFYQKIDVVSGDLADLTNPDIENPVVIYEQMAEDLNVGLKDVIRMKFETVYGQIQTARFTVVALMKSGNTFMNMAIYTHLNTLKPLLGYKDYETSSLRVILEHLKNPDVAVEQANRLHAALQPSVAGYKGMISQKNGQQREVSVFAASPEEDSRQIFASQLQVVEGSLDEMMADTHAVLLSRTLAEDLGVHVGDEVASAYDLKFEGTTPLKQYRVGAIFQENDVVKSDMVFLHANQFYETYFTSPPQHVVELDPENPLSPALLNEWTVLERSPDVESLERKYKELEKSNRRGAFVDVRTIHELASGVLKLESVLDIVTLVAVLILFFIILIGVVNTLRMTIRERTREIGTTRAIGMQGRDVRWSFVLEVVFLAFFACVAGTILAFIGMKFLGIMTFHANESFLMAFLVDKHLYFVPMLSDIIKNLVIILVIAFVTAFFPAGKASKMPVAEALRYYE